MQADSEEQLNDVDSVTGAEFEEALDQAIEQSSGSKSNSSGQSSIEQKLVEAERESLRARAELENFRKRLQRDAELQLKYANMPIMRELLEVIDNLYRAGEAAQADGSNAPGLLEGVQLVTQQLSSVLAKYGCTRIESLGTEFDPNFHEAIGQVPSTEYASGLVAQEVAVGYKLHDRVVRPSSVLVSTGAPNNR